MQMRTVHTVIPVVFCGDFRCHSTGIPLPRLTEGTEHVSRVLGPRQSSRVTRSARDRHRHPAPAPAPDPAGGLLSGRVSAPSGTAASDTGLLPPSVSRSSLPLSCPRPVSCRFRLSVGGNGHLDRKDIRAGGRRLFPAVFRLRCDVPYDL